MFSFTFNHVKTSGVQSISFYVYVIMSEIKEIGFPEQKLVHEGLTGFIQDSVEKKRYRRLKFNLSRELFVGRFYL